MENIARNQSKPAHQRTRTFGLILFLVLTNIERFKRSDLFRKRQTNVSGGGNNTTQGFESSISGGYSNFALGVRTVVIGGFEVIDKKDYSIAPQPPFP
jgi:hypothetical protein